MRGRIQYLFSVGTILAVAALPARAGVNTTAATIIVSNEAPGYLITKLINAGYGGYSPYQVALLLAGMSGFSAAETSDFLTTLANEPPTSPLFTTTLSQYSATGSGIAISTDGTVQVVTINGGTYTGQTGTTTISAGSAAAQNVRMVYSNAGWVSPLASWTVTSGIVTTTYKAFAIAWALADTTAVPALSGWGLLLLTGLVAGAAALGLRRNTRCRAALVPLVLIGLAALPARAAASGVMIAEGSSKSSSGDLCGDTLVC